MTAWQINPLQDPRWASLLHRHPRATVFHTPAWLEALQRTYGYQPVVLTTTAPGEELRNGLVFCRVKSWITGSRNVSLPFSDHCDPLVEAGEELQSLLAAVQRDQVEKHAKYCEIRPLTPPADEPRNLEKADSYCIHRLDLRPDLREIYNGFHKNCIQRKIRRAEQENLTYQQGRTPTLLEGFYHLLILTRRRQQLPPQPFSWFRNLVACMGDKLTIRLVTKAGQPVASILTLRHKDTLVYKYGCSDKGLSNLGGTPFLFWRAIQEAKEEGLSCFDLGRSDWDNPGLITFKDRLGARQSVLIYFRNGRGSVRSGASVWQVKIAKSVLGHMPSALLPLVGSLVYPHLHSQGVDVEPAAGSRRITLLPSTSY